MAESYTCQLWLKVNCKLEVKRKKMGGSARLATLTPRFFLQFTFIGLCTYNWLVHHDLALYLVVLMYYVLELSYEVALFDLESIVCIATVYIDLQIHYITSFCILTIYTHTFLCIFVRIHIYAESFLQSSYIPYISLKEQQRCQSNIPYNTHKHFTRSISNYTSNFRKLLWQKKHHSKTACTLKC